MKELLKSAEMALKRNMRLNSKESILIVTDKPLREVGTAFFEAASKITQKALMVEITPRKNNGEEPPVDIAELMKKVDVLIMPTSKSLSHTNARRAACAAGVRCATLPGIKRDTMVRTLRADYSKIAKVSDKLAALLSKASIAVLTTELGSCLEMSLKGRTGHSDTGLVHSKGNFSNLPAGEAYIAPLENTTNGILVIDGTMAGVGVLSKPIKITVKNGYAVNITGGREAKKLNELLKHYGRKARNIAELGLGTNDKAKLIGSVLEDEKVKGTVHVALGDNRSMGGLISVSSHLDGIVTNPTLTLDGIACIKKGKIVV